MKTDEREMTAGQWAVAAAIGSVGAALFAALTSGLLSNDVDGPSGTTFVIFLLGWLVPMTGWAGAVISQPGNASDKPAKSNPLHQAMAAACGDLLIFLAVLSIVQLLASNLAAMPMWPLLLFAITDVTLRYWLIRRHRGGVSTPT
ncbi:hypothetical protein GCM10009746_30660 [Microbacterium paludicola]